MYGSSRNKPQQAATSRNKLQQTATSRSKPQQSRIKPVFTASCAARAACVGMMFSYSGQRLTGAAQGPWAELMDGHVTSHVTQDNHVPSHETQDPAVTADGGGGGHGAGGGDGGGGCRASFPLPKSETPLPPPPPPVPLLPPRRNRLSVRRRGVACIRGPWPVSPDRARVTRRD